MSAPGSPGRLAGAVGAFATTFRSPALRRAQLGFFGAWTAEWAFTVALGVYAFLQGGAAAVGLVALLRMLPSALLAPFLAPYADRWRREHVLVVVSAVRAVATAIVAALVAVDGPAAVVYGLTVLSTLAATLYRPAHSALLPSLCRTPQELTGANVVRGMLDSLAILAGPAIAALLLTVSGLTTVFVAASCFSAWSAVVMVRVHSGAISRARGRSSVRADVAEGVREVRANRDLQLLFGLTGLQTVTRGALTVFSVVVAIDLLGTGDTGVATFNAAIGVGAVAGSLVVSLLVGTRRLARWFGLGVALWGLPLAVIGVVAAQTPTLLVLPVIGLGNALVDLGLFTLMARLTPDAVMGRVFGLLESLGALSVGTGSILAPLAINVLGLRGALVAVGLVGPLLVALAWRRLTRLDTSVIARDREVGLLRSVAMFRPLPLPVVEHLARSLEPVGVPAGATVFSQGDQGDRFYLIENGTADVLGDGLPVARLGPGEVFGEIALLRRVPRTATVRAHTELQLQSLTGERFVSAVTGVPASAQEASAHVDAELNRYNPAGAPNPSSQPEG